MTVKGKGEMNTFWVESKAERVPPTRAEVNMVKIYWITKCKTTDYSFSLFFSLQKKSEEEKENKLAKPFFGDPLNFHRKYVVKIDNSGHKGRMTKLNFLEAGGGGGQG